MGLGKILDENIEKIYKYFHYDKSTRRKIKQQKVIEANLSSKKPNIDSVIIDSGIYDSQKAKNLDKILEVNEEGSSSL